MATQTFGSGIPRSALAQAARAYRPALSAPRATRLPGLAALSEAPAQQAPQASSPSPLVDALVGFSRNRGSDPVGLVSALLAARGVSAQAGGSPSAGLGNAGGGASANYSGGGSASPQINQLSHLLGIDAAAARAVASVEGGLNYNGPVGDSGTSGGSFQLHRGGALPSNRSVAWAGTPGGIAYALRQIASVAKGLHGRAAVDAIVRRFERPANPDAEVAKAWGRYGRV